jgi:hypothetical protein
MPSRLNSQRPKIRFYGISLIKIVGPVDNTQWQRNTTKVVYYRLAVVLEQHSLNSLVDFE